MKRLAIALLVVLAALGLAASASARTAPSTAPPAGGTISAPSQPPATHADDVSALPRAAASDRSTLFGLTPTAAIVIAAGLLVVVVLAIVAMTRADDSYLDSSRR